MKQPKKWAMGDSIWNYPAFWNLEARKAMVFVPGFWRDRPVSIQVVKNMSFTIVDRLIRSGRICVAIQSEAYREWLRAELLGRDFEPIPVYEHDGERVLLLASGEVVHNEEEIPF